MISHRFVISFQIRDTDGCIEHYPIKDLDLLMTFIRTYGLDYIAKVSLYIKDASRPDATFRNVILRNCDNLFIPEFCEDSIQENRTAEDWTLVSKALCYGNLDDMFVKYIQQPFDI